ncbi:TIGR03619 family F420-dependent LLM class oxidoreductase [Allostreptomyces psammosilenae]|uniref:Putative F420-dependent oxidoreductase n=1 Tax=Allostreptomyces psammosilenae TaxID=1892865 RepID=A0A852ZXQ0_9ACTN|nr:TIGR03619 family F420-dependent LLM class oxidoreductase [Allostreptomyces psammosilenae]NYI03411.1 putative F420-dependent oxidoreductase [Allostreptomyces psammosilenae]
MRVGFTLPQFGTLAHQAGQVTRFAREAERLGADSLWVGDRLLAPAEPTVGYAGGATIPRSFHSVLDPFALLAAAAAVTGRVELGSGVLNAPWYPPVALARSLTSIDQLSDGRLLVGFGTGWSPEEYRAAGVPMRERGARLEECLEVLDAFWSAEPGVPVRHRGRFWDVPPTHVALWPARRPRPPVYLAGSAPAATRRVALRADGWLPVVTVPGDVDPAAAIGEPLRRIRAEAERAGRDPASLGAVLRVVPLPGATLRDVVDFLARARDEAGIDHACVELGSPAENVDQALDLCQRLLEMTRAS